MEKHEQLARVLQFPTPGSVEQINGVHRRLDSLTGYELKLLEEDARARMEEARTELMILAEYRTTHFPPKGGA